MSEAAAKTRSDNKREPRMEWARERLDLLKTTRFYGKVTLTFESGVVTHLNVSASEKPPQ